MNKRILVIGLILGLIGLFFAAKPLISPTITSLNFPNSWKTHLNTKYGHEFLYPANWQVEEWDIEQAANLKKVPDGTIIHQGRFFGPSGHFEILIWSNNNQASVRQWLTWYRHEDLNLAVLPQKENFEIAGLPAIRFLQKETARKKPILYIFFAKGDKIYELTEEREDLSSAVATESAKFVHPTFDKILESFRFVVP